MGDALLVPGWHPMVVHFPLALLLTASALLTLARLPQSARWAPTLSTVGTWNLCLGAFAVMFALGTGLAASLDLQVSEAAHRAVGAHAKAAMLTALLAVLLAVWRGAGTAPESRPSWLFVVLLWCASAALIVTGYRGAQNVYRFGVGVHADATHRAPGASAATAPSGEFASSG